MWQGMNSRAPNPVIHLELHTGDLRGAVDFYTRLFDWRSERIHAGTGSYLALGIGGGVGGGVVECETEHSLWLPYVDVPDVGKATNRAESLGGKVLLGRGRGARGSAAWSRRRTAAKLPSGSRRPGARDKGSVRRVPPARGELRYWLELARLLVDRRFPSVKPARRAATWCSWIPGFMAGDASLTALAGWFGGAGIRSAAAGC